MNHTDAELEWLRGERDRLAADLAKAHKDALAWMEKVHQPAAEIARLREALRRALHLHDIEQAERPTPNVPAWVEDARTLLTEARDA